VIVGVIRRKPVLTHASIVCEGMLASVNSVNSVNAPHLGGGGTKMITFRVSCTYNAKCILVTRVCVSMCVCVSVPRRTPTLLRVPGCNLGNGRGCRLVVHYWADLQSVYGFRCYDNIARTRNISECLYSLYAWLPLVEALTGELNKAAPDSTLRATTMN